MYTLCVRSFKYNLNHSRAVSSIGAIGDSRLNDLCKVPFVYPKNV